MISVKAHELQAAITPKGIAPLYLITGGKNNVGRREVWEEDDYVLDQAVALIKAAVLGGAAAGEGGAEDDRGLDAFNYDLLYGDESDAAEILSYAGEAPVFAPRRLVLLKAAEKLPAREGEALLPYLATPCDYTTLVFVAAKKLDERRKFTQTLYQHAIVVDCSPPSENQLPAWIRAEASRVGVKLNEEAVLLLKDLALTLKASPGGSLYLVRRELEKLAAYVPEGSVAGPADVESIRGGEPGASVFDLAKAIGKRDLGRALYILARNLQAGEDPPRILGALAWQYRNIWKAKDLGWKGEVAELSRHFSESHLREAFQMFARTDSRLKGGSAGPPARVLESLLFALCGSPRDGAQPFLRQPRAREPQLAKSGGTKPISNVRTVRTGRTSTH